MNAARKNARFQAMHARVASATVVVAVVLAACGGHSSDSGVAPPASQGPGATGTGTSTGSDTGTGTPTLRERIAALERSGAYPTLDRSTDIAGPDTNSNGVRDDIEAWIQTQPLNDAQKKALMQDARATQRTLLVDLNDKAALQKAGEGFGASFNCGMMQFPEYSDFSKFAGKIEAMTANTRQRAERYMRYNAARSGSSTRSPDGDTCEP